MRAKGIATRPLWAVLLAAVVVVLALAAAVVVSWLGGSSVSASGLPVVVLGQPAAESADTEVRSEPGVATGVSAPPETTGADATTSTTCAEGSESCEVGSDGVCENRETVTEPLRMHGPLGAGGDGKGDGSGRGQQGQGK